MTEEEARGIYQQGEDAAIAWMLATDQRLRALETRLGRNSQNSSKPPSSDPPGKLAPMSLHKKTGKKQGGQKGHQGTTLRQVSDPDQIDTHQPQTCPHCQTDLAGAQVVGYTPRQVLEMPQPKVHITEHRALEVICPCCGKQARAAFPQGVEHPVQYGPRLLGFACYLHLGHLIPHSRTAQVVQETLGVPFSVGTLHTALRTQFERLFSFEEQAKEALNQADILHVDETGGRVSGKLGWFHTRCTPKLTYLFCHVRRGGEAVKDLRSYCGRLVSDFYGSYVGLNCDHQFCVAHLCRELVGVYEQTGQGWALELKEHLEDCNAACHRARERGSAKLWNAPALASVFDDLVAEGLRLNPVAPTVPGKKRVRRSKARALLDRLYEYREECLGFLFDLSTPFTNNEAERSLRMLKVRGKISGGWRTFEGAAWFCRGFGYLQSCGKQGLNRLECLRSVFAGEPLLPNFQHT
jgi:transposase